MFVLRTAAVLPLVAGLLSVPTPAHAASDAFRFDFDGGDPLTDSSVISDVSGNGNDGLVRATDDGALRAVAGYASSTAVNFPNDCLLEPCARAIIKVPDASSLNPGTRPFTLGAHVLLGAGQTSAGENVVQKGLWSEPGGQLKLQIDGLAGRPSCVVAGDLDGVRSRTVVKSSESVADGQWHQVTCRRSSTAVQVVVDGQVTGSEAAPAVAIWSDAPVTIGGKNLLENGDQFHGQLDDVFLSIG